MAKILRNVRRAMRSGAILMRGSVTGSALSLAMVTSFKESTLEKPTSSLNLDNMKETWSHKFLLQQSRLSNHKKDFKNPFNNFIFEFALQCDEHGGLLSDSHTYSDRSSDCGYLVL